LRLYKSPRFSGFFACLRLWQWRASVSSAAKWSQFMYFSGVFAYFFLYPICDNHSEHHDLVVKNDPEKALLILFPKMCLLSSKFLAPRMMISGHLACDLALC